MPYKDPKVRAEFQARFQRQWNKENPEKRKSLHADWLAKNPKSRAHHQRKYGLKRKGLSLADYDALVKKQHGRCFICRHKPKRKLVVDHCHNTNAFRGLLCQMCNATLGRFRDDPEAARRLLFYLEQNSLFSFNGKKE